MATEYPATGHTTPTRYPDRISYQRSSAHAILDEAYVCHLGLIAGDTPRVLPTLFARVEDTLYLHGSTGSGPMLALRDGGPVCVTVTQLDALVFGRSQFHHSANYRSVVCFGTARPVTDPAEKSRAMTALVDKVAAGRSADSRPPTGRELAATGVLALPLTEVSVKTRSGGPIDEPEDLALPYWAGEIPLRPTPGVPVPVEGVAVPVPGYLRPARSPWLQPVVLTGRHVSLEPLDLCHVPGLFAAMDDEEVWRHIPHPRPASPADLAPMVAGMLGEAAGGTRVPWVQRDPDTGEVMGMTSYAPVSEANRSVHIGSTQLGRRWWRTAVNTEAKLMLMTRAFEELGAVRVEWRTDILNLRSQAAIERLGAVREGVFRRDRQRVDGTWRDTVYYGMTADEWAGARTRLTDRLSRA
jgi:nitroimidazol reductase NimA-like FMN-containing flavoprotein (pyridoxamine 5'-phosphate oxidase superfamily)/RimJ/RimL family protein N-acetyltransferase